MTTIRLLTEGLDLVTLETGGYLLQETLIADLAAESSLSAAISVTPRLLASTGATVDFTAAVTTQIKAAADLQATASESGALSTQIRATAQLGGEASVTPALSTQIRVAASPAANVALVAPVTTSITVLSNPTADSTASGDVATQIKLSAALQSASDVQANLRTSIDAFAAVIGVSNFSDASITTSINMATDISPQITLIQEDGGKLLTEDGFDLIHSNGDPYCEGLLGSIVNLGTNIYVETQTTADLTAQILMASAANAIATVAPLLSTGIRLELTASALSSTTAAITTSIKLDAPFQDDASFSGGITTQIKAVAALVGTASIVPGLSTSINLAASPTALATITAPITTRIALKSDLASASSLTSGITTQIKAAAALNSNAVFVAELKTSINALTALIGVSNVSDAALTVYRVDPHFDRLDNAIYIAELQAYDPATSSVTTWRFSTGTGYDNGGQFYEPRIEQPATLSRSMGGTAAGGRTSQSYGELTLVNNDGGINGLGDDFFDGRTMILKRGNPDMPYSTFATVLVATVESVAMERERISVRLRDKTVTLDTPFSSSKYAGTNVLPSGIEGTADDLKGQAKPRIFGRIALMSPKLVNTSKLIYQVNDGAVDAVVNVFDAGAYLTKVLTDYTSQADMEANAPQAGTWRAWPAGGCFRLGSSPFGQVSVCVTEKWAYNQSNASGIIQRILTEKGYTSANWVASDFSTLSQKNAATLGVIVNDEETTASLLDRICQSVGAWWGFDSLGRFRVARLDAPAGTAVTTLTDLEILELERQPQDKLPLWQTTVKADVNYVVQEKSALAGVVADNRVAWFNTESRDQKVSDSAVKAVRLLAEDESYDSLLNGISQAQAESNRRLSLFSVRRDTVTVTLANPYDHYSSLDLGSVINLQTEKLGYTSGKLFTVTGVNIDYQANTIDLTLWG